MIWPRMNALEIIFAMFSDASRVNSRLASIGRAQRTFLHHEGVKIGNCWDENLWLKLAAKTEELWKN